MSSQVSGRKGNLVSACLWIALIAGAAFCAWKIKSGFQDFIEGYYFGAVITVSIPLGALGIRIIYVLTGGKWGVPLQKYFLSASRTIPFAMVLSLPVLFWLYRIYPWAQPINHAVLHNAAYLNVPFFTGRYVLYFALWSGSAYWLDRQVPVRQHNAKTNLSGLLAVLFALSGTFAALDWIMSLQPSWSSTIFGIMFLTGQVLYAFCFVIMLHGIFKQPDIESSREEAGRFIDIGNIILTMLMFWAYMAFSQFLLIWMANKPEEISWYMAGIKNGWRVMPAVVITLHFFVPFFLLLKQSWKSNPIFLAVLASGIVVMRVVDMGWTIFPNLQLTSGRLSLTHAGAAAVVLSLYLILLLKKIKAYERAEAV
jgi:hypothetical protein